MPDRDTGLKPGDQAVVTIATPGDVWTTIRGTNDCDYAFPTKALHPLPTPSPTAQRVVEAAVEERQKRKEWAHSNVSHAEWQAVYAKLHAATDAHLASLRPADPLAVAKIALGNLAKQKLLSEMDSYERGCADFASAYETMIAEARAAIPLIEAAMKGEG